ncbi:hypothetical protein HHI36_005208 [Cryptolaemus montrouzieri]|uniref:Uncharacterized protein n=1 Tax=Cryptolaemus montrouzieri TaxID=559131 RepID=A0ABD2NUZ3_9CUCU
MSISKCAEATLKKKLCVNDPTRLFEVELYDVLCDSDKSENEDDIEQFLVSETELIQHHESENESNHSRDEEEIESDDSDESFSELQSSYYYGKNRSEWAKAPSTSRVCTLQHNIITFRIASSKLTIYDKKDPFDIWNKLFDDDMMRQILTWTNAKIGSIRTKFARLGRPELKGLDIIELKAFFVLLFYSA